MPLAPPVISFTLLAWKTDGGEGGDDDDDDAMCLLGREAEGKGFLQEMGPKRGVLVSWLCTARLAILGTV